MCEAPEKVTDEHSLKATDFYKELYKHYADRIAHFENFQRNFVLFTVPILAYVLQFLLSNDDTGSAVSVKTAYYGTLLMLSMFHFYMVMGSYRILYLAKKLGNIERKYKLGEDVRYYGKVYGHRKWTYPIFTNTILVYMAVVVAFFSNFKVLQNAITISYIGIAWVYISSYLYIIGKMPKEP